MITQDVTAATIDVTGSGPIYLWGFLNRNANTAQLKLFAKLFKSLPVDIHKPSIPDPIVRGEDIIICINDALYNESINLVDLYYIISQGILFSLG